MSREARGQRSLLTPLTCSASSWVTDKLEHVTSKSFFEPRAELEKLSWHSCLTTSFEEAYKFTDGKKQNKQQIQTLKIHFF